MLSNLDGEEQSIEPPLVGLKVVAWEQFVAAPFATRHLADLGADVIKIERPGAGDPQRQNDTLANGLSAYFVWNNRNKRSLALDLKSSRDRSIFDSLLATADIFIHNFGPGVVERAGYGYEAVSSRNPRLICCAISGYGEGGPYDDRRAMDAAIQGEAGFMSITGTETAPSKSGAPIADIAAGMSAVVAILAALAARSRTGKGANINVSMLEALADWCAPHLLGACYSGKEPPRSGGRNPYTVPHGVYMCAEGEPISIIPLQNWNGFCAEVLQRPELVADERFSTNATRVANRTVLEPIIEEILATIPRAEVARRLLAIGATYGDVNDMHAVLEHSQLAARHRWFDVPSAVGPIRMLHHPFNIVGVSRPNENIPTVGQHRDEILRELGVDTVANAHRG